MLSRDNPAVLTRWLWHVTQYLSRSTRCCEPDAGEICCAGAACNRSLEDAEQNMKKEHTKRNRFFLINVCFEYTLPPSLIQYLMYVSQAFSNSSEGYVKVVARTILAADARLAPAN